MSGYHKIIAHRPVTKEELSAVMNLIWEGDMAHDQSPPSELHHDPPFGFVYHIGFAPDDHNPNRTFISEDDGHTVEAWGWIYDDEPMGFGTQLFGWGHDHQVTCEGV